MDSHTFSIEFEGQEIIWDVQTLWKAARGIPILTLFVGGFEEARDVQEWLNNPGEYGEDMSRVILADLSFPIILHPSWFVMDGYHRLGKCLLHKLPTIQAVRFLPENLPPPDRVRTLPVPTPI